MSTYQPPSQPAPYYPEPRRHRPIGVTILAILEILTGVLSLLASFGFFVLGAIVGSQDLKDQLGPNVPQWILDNGPVFFAGIGVLFLLFAIVAFLLAWGFLRGKSWARVVGIVFAVLNIAGSIVSALVSGNVVNIATVGFSVIIPVVILLYLMLPSTKTWFTQ
jgi:hypothetical protein